MSTSGIPNVPARRRPNPPPGTTPLARSHIAHIDEHLGAVSGTTLVRCIGAAVALPGIVVLAVCLYAFLSGYDAASALIGTCVGAQFAAVGFGIFHFAYLAGPLSAAQKAEFLARHRHDL